MSFRSPVYTPDAHGGCGGSGKLYRSLKMRCNRRHLLNPLSPLILFAIVFNSTVTWGGIIIEWVHPEKYSDAREDVYDEGRYSESVLRHLEASFRELHGRILGTSLHLEMRVTDVDLAGELEPGLRLGSHETRIIKDHYPARIRFFYTLRNSERNVIDQGEESLKSVFPASFVPGHGMRPYPYIKKLVQDWMRKLSNQHYRTKPSP
jgi:hypothetical protein